MTLIIKKKCNFCSKISLQENLWEYRLDEKGDDILVEKCPNCGGVNDFKIVGSHHFVFSGFGRDENGIGC